MAQVHPSEARAEAERLMREFAVRTGLDGGGPPRRYLWTDAFAVGNFLDLVAGDADSEHRRRALALVDQVHQVLGRHRADDPRSGWISGLDEAHGAAHPTRGGLRIGKPLPERAPGESFDERLEWERDGQYFHYLTRWMHALDRCARATREPRYLRWACELAVAAHRGFTFRVGGQLRKAWKMRIDLSAPLVPSMGQHDPLDGLVTCLELRATAADFGLAGDADDLAPALADYTALCENRDWATEDPLGLGGLLMLAAALARLPDAPSFADADLTRDVLRAALRGLPHYLAQRELDRPATQRLAFRELGLAIGLHRIARLRGATRTLPANHAEELGALARYLPLADVICIFWRQPAQQHDPTWRGHRDINEVMLAACLLA